jgi:galactokinase
MTGGGFGGCTVNLVRPDALDRLRDAVLREYPGRTGLTPTVFPLEPVAGAGVAGSDPGPQPPDAAVSQSS